MKPRINFRAERAERTGKMAEKKQARLAALSRSIDEASVLAAAPKRNGSMPHVHRFSD